MQAPCCDQHGACGWEGLQKRAMVYIFLEGHF
jgi:hypothetical protein